MKYCSKIALILSSLIPALAYAAQGAVQLMDAALKIIKDILIPLAFSLCLLYFFWGVAKYIRNAGNEKTASEGKRIMVWGVVGLFVAVSVWGIIRFLQIDILGGPGPISVPIQPVTQP